MEKAEEIIRSQYLEELIAGSEPNDNLIGKILQKGLKKKGLKIEEAAVLLNVADSRQLDKIYAAAAKIKQEIYGERVVLFAPLYASNYCVNDCEYCGFHLRNKSERKKLILEEIAEQVKIIEDMGHKRILLEFGEDPLHNPIDYVVDVINTIYQTRSRKGSIRRVNVNIAATSVENYRKLKKAGIGTYQLFQETYHLPTYKALHHGPKADYERQFFAHDRAFEAGIDDVGMGVLFGLHDYRFEVLALLLHAQYFEKKFGVGPHTISVPRFQPADTVTMKSKYMLSDDDFLKLIAVIRITLPYTGMIISTRERPEIRMQAIKIGISQASGGSRTSPGGYGKHEQLEQFTVSDSRDLDEIVLDLLNHEYIPSFCTACYRSGRTGQEFMKLAKPGRIQELCRPNALLTFQEYLEDYASDKTKEKGSLLVSNYLKQIANSAIRKEAETRLKRIASGERDLYF